MKLSSLDLAINPTTEGAEEMDLHSSISNNLDARAKFKEYGYYSISDFIYKVGNDGARPPNPTIPFFKNDLKVIFLNTNACNNRNVALMEEITDPGG